MLQRTSLLDKKKKKKVELEKVVSMAKNKIEYDLKHQNKKGDDDYIDLTQIEPFNTKFILTDDLTTLLPNLIKQLEEYVNTNNEYVNVKT